jgi:hypothetical protein
VLVSCDLVSKKKLGEKQYKSQDSSACVSVTLSPNNTTKFGCSLVWQTIKFYTIGACVKVIAVPIPEQPPYFFFAVMLLLLLL